MKSQLLVPSPQRSENMRRIRGKDTRPELQVRTALHKAGYRFRLHRRDVPGSPDIVLPRYQMAIWVHGCFWHGHECRKGRSRPATNVEFWSSKIARTKERDTQGREEAKVAGWKTRVVWECTLKSDVELLISELNGVRENR